MGKTLGSILQVVVGAALLFTGNPTGLGLILSGVSGLFAGDGPKPDTVVTSVKTSRPPRVSGYGISRLYGAVVLFETASDGTATDVYAVHDGAMDGVVGRYLGDKPVTLTGTTVNEGDDGRYKGGAVGFYETSGAAPGAGIPAITALVPEWTGRGDGVVLLGVTAKSVKAKDFSETYPDGRVPEPSLVARWQKCPDPAAADPLDESGWTHTENGVRHLLHYKLVREGPRPALPKSDAGYAAALATLRAQWWSRNIAPTLDFWIEAAAVCDAPRALKAGGTEPMYRSSVAHKHTDEHKGPTAAILATFDGWLSPRADGALVIYAGKIYDTDEADLIGSDEIISYTWEGGPVDDDEAINEVICTYISSLHDYNTVDCDAWRDEADISRRGQVLSEPLEAQVPSHAQSRYLAKRFMARKNAPKRGTISTNIAGRKAQGKRFVPIHLEEAGRVFYSGPAEIISLSRDIRGGVTFQWVAVDPAVDAWNPATEEGEPAALGDRVAAEPLDAPVINSATVTAGPSTAKIDLDVTGPARDDLTWFTRWKITTDSAWSEQETADTDAGAAVALAINIVPSNESIDTQAAYAVGDGRTSPWSATSTVNSAAPTFAAAAVIADASGGLTTVTGPVLGEYTITKGAGGSAAFDASAVSATAFSGNAVAKIYAPTNAAHIAMAGLSTAPNTTDSFTDISFAVYFDGTATLNVFESGALVGPYGTYAPGDVFWVVQAADGTAISYWKGATLAGATLLYSHAVTGAPLFFDSSLFSPSVVVKAGLFQRA